MAGIGLAVMLCLAAATAGQQESEVVVIVAPTSGGQSVSRSTLRAIYGMRLHKWPDGMPIRVFVYRDDHPDHVAFSKSVLQVFPHQLRQAWDRLVFSGLGQYPEQVATPQEMLTRVSATPGAVGYVKSSEVNQNVHILQVH